MQDAQGKRELIRNAGFRASINPYIDKLDDFPGKAFAHESVFSQRNQWGECAEKLMGCRPEKLILEIGCSNGTFLNELAQEHSHFAFVGMDWKFKLIHKAATKSQKLTTKNTLFLRGRAQDLTKIFGAHELDEVWLFFPDPWPKASQQKHRLFQEPFLKSVSEVLKPGGSLYIKTDHPGYFEWMCAVMGIEFQSEFLPEFMDAAPDSGVVYNNRDRQFLHRKYANKDLPARSSFACEAFSVVQKSSHYWNDVKNAQLKVEGLFADKKTLFEEMFYRDQLPVYFLHLKNMTSATARQ